MKKTIILGWFILLAATVAWPQSKSNYTRTEDVIYGRKFGTALTLDVFQPETPNGSSILFMVSGGFFSSHEAINAGFYRPFLERGYTVFAIVHGSQPKFIIPEITQGHFRKLGEKSGIVEKAMDEAENDVYDARHENSPVGADARIL